jgi:RNA-directed DNA polymerase
VDIQIIPSSRQNPKILRLKQCKRARTIAAFLLDNGVPERRAWKLAGSGKGWWRLAAHEAMRTAWFGKLGLISLAERHAALNAVGTAGSR